MNAARLPGKPLLPIAGKPLIHHVIEAVSGCPEISETVVVTTNHPADKPLKEYLEKQGISYSDGDENDIVGRFYTAAEKFQADAVVRLWGDCPLINSRVIQNMIQTFKKKGGFITNSEPRSFPIEC